MRNPLRERLDVSEPFRAALRNKALPEPADQIFGRPVMVGEVPTRKPGIVVAEHRIDRALRVDPAMRPRHLPHPVQYVADAQTRRELKPARLRQRHQIALFAFNAARSAAPSPRFSSISALCSPGFGATARTLMLSTVFTGVRICGPSPCSA